MSLATKPRSFGASGRPHRTPRAEDTLTVDVRVIAATHRDSRQRFAPAGFERTSSTASTSWRCASPLRERDDDVVVLARHFAAQLAQT